MKNLKQFMNLFAKHDISEFPGVLTPMSAVQRRKPPIAPKGSKGPWKWRKPTTSETKASTSDSNSESSQRVEVFSVEVLRVGIERDVADGAHDTPYDRKSKVINEALQDIGMGRYQWELFILCGMGWLADNLWLQGVALTLPSLSAEFGIAESPIRYTTLALFAGLCIGASFWGIASDVIGRRPAFNFTLLIAGIFGLAAGGATDWIGVCGLYACVGLGIGGNLPIDGALFLEFLPGDDKELLTLLSVWWPVGQLIASLLAWPLIANYSCAPGLQSCSVVAEGESCCGKANNWGWRYFILSLGALTFFMFLCRFFLFELYESPKFLLSRGRQAEAVAVVHGIAYHNEGKTWLTEDILNEIGGHPDVVGAEGKLSTLEILRRNLSKFSTKRISPLFSTRKDTRSTLMIWLIWSCIGMGYPLFNAFLPQYLGTSSSTSPSITYRNYAITSVVGVPGSLIAWQTVKVPWIGRKGTMGATTIITGVFLFCFTISTDSSFQLTFSGLEAFFQNVAYGVLYAYTPEVFPAPNRGTGTGISSFLNRLTGLCAPIVAVNVSASNPRSPIYASGALFFAAAAAMGLLPYETAGRESL